MALSLQTQLFGILTRKKEHHFMGWKLLETYPVGYPTPQHSSLGGSIHPSIHPRPIAAGPLLAPVAVCSIEIAQQYKQKTMASKPKQKSKKKIEEGEGSEVPWYYLGDTELGHTLNDFTNSNIYAVISTIIMFFTLFADDVREIWFPPESDEPLSYATLICMIYYTVEIVTFSLIQKDYFMKYYFWLDLISTSTMCLDLIWVSQFITGSSKNAANISQITKASRAARLGTRTVRLIRLVRMIKIMRQMKSLSKELVKSEAEEQGKKLSQRLSSIHSRLASLRNIDPAARHMEKLPSKRWSLIKETGCMNMLGIPKEPAVSINCLPFKDKDVVLDREDSMSAQSASADGPAESRKLPSLCRVQDARSKVMALENIEEQAEEKPNLSKFKLQQQSRLQNTHRDLQHRSEEEIEVPAESKVGARVQGEIQKNVILMIILILISIPILDASTWFNGLRVYDRSFNDVMYFAYERPELYQAQADLYIADASNFLNPLAYFLVTTPNITDAYPTNYNFTPNTVDSILLSARSGDLDVYSGNGYIVGYDISWYNKLTAMMNIGRTIFVCILLITATMLFSNDLEFAAIAPLEDMFQTVKKIAVHPLNALREIEQRNLCLQRIEEEADGPQTEPQILQNTIVKIGSLLAVGFGEAGTQIICKVIEDPAIIDVMIPGQKVMALFGFCDIRNFTDATEVLEADVMVFVNEIAAICHRVTFEHLGSPNKNIGDAFLLVWKFARSDCKITQSEEETNIELLRTPKVAQQADLAVLALLKMIADITKAHSLQKYKNNKGLQERIPNYNGVKMGFGLHVGWAIEGPIGSEYKIDASYLGSHVHMASRLEGATKGYGASMLITGQVYQLMSRHRSNLRHIDRVMPTGDSIITDLYTVDIVPKHLFQELGVRPELQMDEKEKKLAKLRQNKDRRRLAQGILKDRATDALWNDEDIRIMQEPYTARFYEEWRKGFKNYLEGHWEAALEGLNSAKTCAPNGVDGPTDSLIKFIEEHKGKAPENWAGYRDFD